MSLFKRLLFIVLLAVMIFDAGTMHAAPPNPAPSELTPRAYLPFIVSPPVGRWSSAGNMSGDRESHTATLLPAPWNKVLVTGGASGSDLYDPQTNSWLQTGPMIRDRRDHTATLLNSGKVLVAGGWVSVYGTTEKYDDSELYDPGSKTWSEAGKMSETRRRHSALLLSSGQVLVYGNDYEGNDGVFADLYDPNGGWSGAWPSDVRHDGGSYTLLKSGRVLAAGGIDWWEAAAVWDPNPDKWWEGTGYMINGRAYHAAILLTVGPAVGKVLVAGGRNDTSMQDGLVSAELYDPSSEKWSAAGNMSLARWNMGIMELKSGKVLVAGGAYYAGGSAYSFSCTKVAEIFDPTTSQWRSAGNMSVARCSPKMILLPSGQVFVIGGWADQNYVGIPSAELYDPASNRWLAVSSMITARYSGYTLTLLPSGQILVTGGLGAHNTALSSAELWTP